ncbi:MAG: hypothetical protein ACYSWU_00730 [Planctomycetota bacterium]
MVALLASFPAADVCRAGDSPAEQRRRIEKEMQPAEKKQLKRDYDWFMGLKPAERERLRELHKQLKDAPELRRVLHAYCQWLDSLPAYTRTELRELDPKERIKRIQELRAEEAKRPKPKDMEGLHRWMQKYAAEPEHQERLLQEMFKTMLEAAGSRDPERLDKMKKGFDDIKRRPERRSFFAMMALRMQMSRPDKPDWLTEDNLAEIRKNLSDDTRERLESQPADDQWDTISRWFRMMGRGRSFGRRPRGGPPPKELQEFFEKELTPQQKEELLHLPGDQMQRRLEGMYFWRFMPTPGPGFGPWGPGRMGPPRDRSGRSGRGSRGEGPRGRREGSRGRGEGPRGRGDGPKRDGPKGDGRPRER